ncbi:MAG: hypothetical protein JNL61_07825 [Rhizobiaceae bacterium]|nr:hypothetical protein [Rhizobiaceae bacterium]
MSEMGTPRRRATLVMFSAGIDSTYTLVRLLQETDDEIYAHHVHMVNVENRHEVEARRSRAIAEHCMKTIRKFHYSETSIDHRNMRWFGYDIISVGFEAGIVAHSFHMARKRPMDRWTIGTCEEEGHDEERFAHVLAACAANCYPTPPPAFFLLPLIPKAEEIAYLPRPVVELCWTCRRPVAQADGPPAECGTCKTCKLMLKIRAERGTSTADAEK